MIRLTDLLQEVLEEITELNEEPLSAAAALAGAAFGTWRANKGIQRMAKNNRGDKTSIAQDAKQFAKGALGLPDERAEKKPGQTWKTPTGRFGGMNRDGNTRYYKDQQAASTYAKS